MTDGSAHYHFEPDSHRGPEVSEWTCTRCMFPEMKNTFRVVKENKRLWIRCVENGENVYTPPNFVVIPTRSALLELAYEMTRLGRRDIEAIARFETKYKRKA